MQFKPLAAAALAASAIMAATPAIAVPTVTSDPILFWNETAVTLLPGGAPGQTRAYAMINVAMYDAVNAALGFPGRRYTKGVSAAGGDSRAAASRSARDLLVLLNPANAAAYDAAYAASLALVPDGPDKTQGIATGAAYANAVWNKRLTDGSGNVVPYTTTGLPGDWRPTTPGTPAVPHWGSVTPFTMASGDQFRAPPPPALDSPEYAVNYNEVKAIGCPGCQSNPDQTAAALFWDAAAGAPWMRIGIIVAEDEALSTFEFARSFALLSTSLADAIIAGFDSKYHYRLWRPLTAIQLGDTDGNPATDADAAWTSLFPAPLHPSYISTHSALSGAGSSILISLFGDDQPFSFTIGGDSRSFDGLLDAALDGADSRLWGGIHFRFDNDAGLEMGRAIGEHALAGRLFDVPAPSALALFAAGAGLLPLLRRRRRQAR